MKRLFAVMVVLIMAGTAVYGAGPFFGAKLGMGIGFHGDGKDMEDMIDLLKDEFQANTGDSLSVKGSSGPAFALSPYLGYYFTDKVAVQTELNFIFGQKKTWELSSPGYIINDGESDIEGKYSSLDIPVLLRFNFINQPALFGLVVGPQFSIPLGDIETTYFGESEKIDADGVTVGIAAGLFTGYPLGLGRLIGDLRFIMDFNAVKAKSGGESRELIKRRGINITVGYEFLFGGN
jgi:hypothetical protein